MTSAPTVFMFTGLGAQYFGMGHDLYRGNPTFRSHVDALDGIVGHVARLSIAEVIFDADKRTGAELHDPLWSSLATFLIERALTRTMIDNGITPNLVLGSSIGMFASCVSARCFDDEQAVRVIAALGHIFRESCAEGCMIAVLDRLDVYHDSALLTEAADLAGVNFEGGFVIALPRDNLREVEGYLKRTQRTFQIMPVSRAYHSRWIDDAEARALDLFATLDLRRPAIPVVCCSKARELRQIAACDLWGALRDPMSFQQSIARLEGRGTHTYVDMGPSGTMASFLKYALPSTSASQRFSILSPFGRNERRLDDTLASLARAVA